MIINIQTDWPVGNTDERSKAWNSWPGDWFDANGYLNFYEISLGVMNFHTGSDLNLNKPNWDSDFHSPVYSIANGRVIYAGKAPMGWGTLIVVAHYFSNGEYAFSSRYGHVENISVRPGDFVRIGQQIAQVGDGDGIYKNAVHLHFDISETACLLKEPTHWPNHKYGNDIARKIICVEYSDPLLFMQTYKLVGYSKQAIEINSKYETTDVLNIRTEPLINAKLNNYLAKGKIITALDIRDGYVKYDNSSWVFSKFLKPYYSQPTSSKTHMLSEYGFSKGDTLKIIEKTGLRLREQALGTPIGVLPYNETVVITGDNAIENGSYIWVKLRYEKENKNGFAAIKTIDGSATYLELNKPPVIIVPPVIVDPTKPTKVRISSKIGLHLLPKYDVSRFKRLLNHLSSINKPLASVTNCYFGWGDAEITNEYIKNTSPNTIIVYRPYNPDWERYGINWNDSNNYESGKKMVNEYFVRFVASSRDAKYADFHQIICEPTIGSNVHLFWLGAMDAANVIGIKLALYNYSTGFPLTPFEEGWSKNYSTEARNHVFDKVNQINGYFWPFQKDVLDRSITEKHLISLHQYLIPDPDSSNNAWFNDWSIMRHKRILSQIPQAYSIKLNIGFTEYGTAYAESLSNNSFEQSLKYTDDQLKKDDSVNFANYWTLGNGVSWNASEIYGDKIDILENYLANYS